MICLAFFGLSLELGVRWKLGAPRFERLPLLRIKPDPRFGYVPVPRDVHYAYDQLTKLNSLGLRGPEVESIQEGEYRILVLGETQVYGPGLADDELITNVLEHELNKGADPGHHCKVINLGVRAYALNQQFALLELLGVGLEPDYVVLLFYIFSYRSTDISRYYKRARNRDWYMVGLGGKPTGSALFKWRIVQLARKSALVASLHSMYKSWESSPLLVGI
jgi:hypothetical protein